MKENLSFYQYDDLRREFKEFKQIPIYEDLNSNSISLFSDSLRKRMWIWYGSNTTTKMKFLATKLALAVRDRYYINFGITAVNEGNETLGFKIMIGVEDESDYSEAQLESYCDRTNDDVELFESLYKELKMSFEKASNSHEDEAENKVYCKHCASKLSKKQKICPVCGKAVI